MPFSPSIYRSPSAYRKIAQPLFSLLDFNRSGLIKPKLQGIFVPSPPKARNVCQKCNKRLSGKLVRLPDSKERYHWSCLKREDCKEPFKSTFSTADPSKKVCLPQVQYH